jgi:uncharacterized protein (UPF0261 family)
VATVVLLGTLDTKGAEYEFVRKKLQDAGCQVILIDAGILGAPLTQPDISREEVAKTVGADVATLVATGDRGAAIEVMARGATKVVSNLYAAGRLSSLLGLGGSGGSSLVTQAMQALPIGVPKLLVSTMASGDTRPYVGAVDVTIMHSVVDFAGINRISHRILSNAAAAIAGMAMSYENTPNSVGTKPLVATTMFGVTTPCIAVAREQLESLGYEVLVFHATGTGGRAMEALVRGGFFVGVLDITTTELADELVGGVLSAGSERLEAAGEQKLPQVVSLGALDMVNFGPLETVPEQFRQRNLYKHNATVTLMRTTPAECAQLGQMIAHKLNKAKGPTVLFVPLRGVSAMATEGGVFHAKEADKALIDALVSNLNSHVTVHQLDMDINDPRFAKAMVDEFHRLIEQSVPRSRSKP